MNKTILLIEDNEQNRYLATFLLEKRGYSVVPASDGVTGIQLGLRFQPKGILLDIHLPGLDGYEVARALRRNACWRRADHRGNLLRDGRIAKGHGRDATVTSKTDRSMRLSPGREAVPELT